MASKHCDLDLSPFNCTVSYERVGVSGLQLYGYA